MVGTVSQCVPVYPSVTLDTPGHFRHHQTPELWLAPIRVYCLSCHLPMITSHPIIIITTALLVSMLKDPVWLCDCVTVWVQNIWLADLGWPTASVPTVGSVSVALICLLSYEISHQPASTQHHAQHIHCSTHSTWELRSDYSPLYCYSQGRASTRYVNMKLDTYSLQV